MKSLAPILAVALLLAACGGGAAATPSTASPTSSPSPPSVTLPPESTATSAPTDAPAACEDGSGLTEPQMQGPYSHQIYRAFSADGETFVSDNVLLLDHASVPDGIQHPDGEIWVYYVSGEPGQHGVFAAREGADGAWEVVDCVRISGVFEPNAVDPDIVLLPDGRYRLFYFLGAFVGVKPEPGEPHPIYTAISDDGLNFEVEGQVFAHQNITDPSAVYFEDGSWLMVVTSMDGAYMTRSADGVGFELTGDSFPPGIPELMLLPDGRVRLLLSGPGGILSYISTDRGETWSQEAGLRLSEATRLAADPSVTQLADGSWLMFWKTINPEAGP